MGSLVGGGNAILLLLTGMAVGGALIIAFIAHRRRNAPAAQTFAGGAALLALAYAGGVVAASATSTERTIAAGDTKWFCGFYLDCHLGLSVERAETATSLGPAGPVPAKGAFRIVTLRLHNNAKNPNLDMLLYRPNARIVDASGNTYARSREAEAALTSDRPPALAAETSVGHEPVEATIAFDLPANVQQPRLIVSEGWIAARVLEMGLIGDENSIFHKRTFMALDGSTETTSALEQ